jgi:adenylate cyclase
MDPEVLARCKDAGLYDPASSRAGEREELLDHLVGRFGLEPVLDAATRAPLFAVAVELTDPQPPRMTAREAAEASGLSVEDVLLVRAAVGFPAAGPDERSVAPEMVEDAEVVKAAFEMFGRDRTLVFTRVLGAVARQVADAARAVFATSLVEDAEEGTVTELELSVSNEIAWLAYRQVPTVVSHLILERSDMRHDTRQDLIQSIVEGDLQAGIVFVDLVGSTAWTAATDPRRHAHALARFEQAAWEIAIAHGGRLVKLIGDEAMVATRDEGAACRIATALCAEAAADPDLPEARAGVAFGEVMARSGDYFGATVNLAARLLQEAAPGTVVVTQAVVDGLDPSSWVVTSRGSAGVRGVPGPVDVFSVTPAS